MTEFIKLTRIRLVKGKVDEEPTFVTEFAIRDFDTVETGIIRYTSPDGGDSDFYVFDERTEDELFIYRRVEVVINIVAP